MSAPLRLVAIILGVIFVSETTTMLIFDAFPPLPDLVEAILNAAVLSLIVGSLLYFLHYEPSRRREADQAVMVAPMSEEASAPMRTVAILLGVIFVAEMATMLLLDAFPPLPDLLEATFNALVLSFVLGALLYYLVYEPMRRQLTERDQAIASLTESEQRFRDIAEASDEWIWELDENGRYTFASPAVERILGFTGREVIGKHFHELYPPEDREMLKREMLEVFAERRPLRGFINCNVHKNGGSVWLATNGVPIIGDRGELAGYRGAHVVKFHESTVTDPLTGVLNRSGFYLLAEHHLKMCARTDNQVAVLFGDLDGLKEINDEFGHQRGDRAIAQVAEIMRCAVRRSDVVARFGGDEFVVLLGAPDVRQAVDIVTAQIDERLQEFNESGELPFPLCISIGVAADSSPPTRSVDALIDEADMTMYARKRATRRPEQQQG